MRIGLLTEGGYPYVSGDAGLWCDRLVRGLGQHEFQVYALSRSERQEAAGQVALPPHVTRVRTAPLWTAEGDGVVHGRRARRRFTEHYGALVSVLCEGAPADVGTDRSSPQADRFGNALYGLAELARDEGGLVSALRSEGAVRALERACRAPGAVGTAREARVPDLLAVAGHLEHALRPLSLDWYEDDGGDGLGSVDLCHAASGGAAALPGLLARHFFGVPLLVTEYGVRLRTHYLAGAGAGARGAGGVVSAGAASLSGAAPGPAHGPSQDPVQVPVPEGAPAVRSLLAAFHGRLAAEVYRQAACVTSGNAHARRWQERCGADRAKLRTVHPGMDASRFAEVGDSPDAADPRTLVWVGRVEPAKDLVSLLHAFAEIRKEEPGTRLRILGASAGAEGEAYLGHCRMLAAQLFPDEAAGRHSVGDNPVSFEEIGGPEVPGLAEAYAAGAVVVLSSVVEGFPAGLVEAMFCGRSTVSTDVGAVVEVIGGTGLVVPSRNPRALAEACVALLRDPGRRARLGAAARARALELFTVEQNTAAFHGIYLEVVSRSPVRRGVLDAAGEPRPFAVPAEAWLPGRWTGLGGRAVPRYPSAWTAGPPVRGTAAARGSVAAPASSAPRTTAAPAPAVATEGAR
ncbi:DUF3492 domain-containing protein [Streptomyces phaeoluteigriseus]|uniref:D-inositol 3-phosphate glycosyltransferase n=1 Tax=Streptomyces phaeoluteigriseus TaxID=114686 RepID=A0ABY4Z3V2_9ACTN|nr:DUF3492 domain-containing protein [Streptomyces phaeoluteigriseus]USQ83355.1 DUF3492 domain-containing protein [Streptomyces phaeoluteigriseus]